MKGKEKGSAHRASLVEFELRSDVDVTNEFHDGLPE